jgi:hypothetical protein
MTWMLAALLQVKHHDDAGVKIALGLLQDANRHTALRGVAAIFVGRFGDHARRRTLISMYPSVSPYIQAAIYFHQGGGQRLSGTLRKRAGEAMEV